MLLDCAGRVLDLSRPRIMGILNVTPDSFSDGGRFQQAGSALCHARQMVAEGADIIDVGGESTRPQADKVSVQEELDRVVPVIEHLAKELDVLISVDTSTPEVMRAAVAAGADIINDVRALRRDGALEAAAACDVPVVLMHSLVEQPADGFVPLYKDVVADVAGYLAGRKRACQQAGIPEERIILDPGFGGGMFGKTPAYDLELVKRVAELHSLGSPLLVGVSRKSFIGSVLNNEVSERLPGSLAVALMLVQSGAQIVRVHDVRETADVLRMLAAVDNA